MYFYIVIALFLSWKMFFCGTSVVFIFIDKCSVQSHVQILSRSPKAQLRTQAPSNMFF